MISPKYRWVGSGNIFADFQELFEYLKNSRSFLGAELDYESAFHDSYVLPDFQETIQRVLAAREKGEKVAIYGDYDVDGVSSSAILFEALNLAGISVITYLPHREDDGYGLSEEAIKKIAPEVTLLITIDNGTSAHAAIEAANKRGLEVIVIDHHTVQETLPKALVVNPHRVDNKYPFVDLSAAGLAFKFAKAFLEKIGRGEEAKWLLDLSALGTLADRVKMTDENRAIARFGLKVIKATRRPGLIALLNRAGISRSKCDAESLTFKIIPRLNAAGRMEHPDLAFNLLTTKNPVEAEELAAKLDQLNQARRKLTDKATSEIKESLVRSMPLPEVVCVSGDWPAGILGILAGKIAEDLGRPTAAINIGKNICTGSIRGNGVVNVCDILSSLSHVFTKFGGHHEAGGFSFLPKDLPSVEKYFSSLALSGEAPTPSLNYDAIVSPLLIQNNLLEFLLELEPYGEGNERPVFMLQNLRVEDLRMIGSGKEHARFLFSHEHFNQGSVSAVAFRWNERELPPLGTIVDVLCEVRLNDYNNNLDLHIKDLRTPQSEKVENLRQIITNTP